MGALSIDPREVTQTNLGEAIVSAQRIRRMEDTEFGPRQESLGEDIVAATRAQQARGALVPGFRVAARESLLRMHGMIQQSAGRAVVHAAQRMWRAGNTETAQLQFIETLGRIKAGTILREQAASPLREEALGWSVVGGLLAMDRHEGQVQELLGSALRDTGTMAARINTGMPLAQEALGSAVLVAAQAATSPIGASSVLTASAAGGTGTSEIPYQAGVILFAALFTIVWGVRTVAQSGTSLPVYETAPSPEEQYRKAG